MDGKNKVVFLDRDGVINEYPGDTRYVCNWKEFKFIPGSIEGIKKLKRSGFKIFIVSNQAGVSKGIYSLQALDEINRRMRAFLRREGTDVDGIYYCIHRDEDNCSCRKPKKGLLEKALQEHNVSSDIIFFIGDSFRDMEAARDFGAKSVLVLSGKEKISNRNNWPFEPDFIFDNLLLAANFLYSNYGE